MTDDGEVDGHEEGDQEEDAVQARHVLVVHGGQLLPKLALRLLQQKQLDIRHVPVRIRRVGMTRIRLVVTARNYLTFRPKSHLKFEKSNFLGKIIFHFGPNRILI